MEPPPPARGSEKPKRLGKKAKAPNGSVLTKSTSALVKTGKEGLTKKRKKSSKATSDPSVQLAKEWTDRAEQAEERRAREPEYTTPLWEEATYVTPTGTTTPASSTADVTRWLALPLAGGTGDYLTGAPESIAPAKMRTANRPWEWSAKDCRDLLVDANDSDAQTGSDVGVNGEGEKASDGECTAKEVSVSLDSEGTLSETASTRAYPSDCSNARSGSQHARSRGRSCPPAGTKRRLQQEPPRPLRTKNASGKGGVNIPPERVETAVDEFEPPKGRPNRNKSMSTPFNPSPREVPQQRTILRRRHDPQGITTVSKSQPANAGVRFASQMAEDERKARELSAELNRNCPRRGARAEEKHRQSSRSLSPFKLPQSAEEDRDIGGDKVEHIGRGSLRSRNAEDGRSTGGVNGGWRMRGDSWFKNVGAVAEVWWGKAWYRCVLDSVTEGGKLGVLEFLPSNNRRIGRMYSLELDLDEWIRVGHLVRPKTHLGWD